MKRTMKGLMVYGWILALLVSLASFAVAAYLFNPVEVAEKEVAEPAAVALGLIEGMCPEGWEDNSLNNEEHVHVNSCVKDTWIVILNDKKEFSYGFELDNPDAHFVFDPAQVPGWSE